MRFRDLNPLVLRDVARGIRLTAREPNTVVFVSSLLRPREIKLATALRHMGWKVILLYKQTTPFHPERHFDLPIRLPTELMLARVAKLLQPRVCHIFSGAVDDAILALCRDKPGPIVVDLNDIFCSALFNYHPERFAPTQEILSRADGLVSRDLQPKVAQRMDGFTLPPDVLLFPEYSWIDGPAQPGAAKKLSADEVHVVSVGTFTLESQNMYDSAYLQLARLLAERKIHLHIYPHWFYRDTRGSAFRFNQEAHFADFYALAKETPYLHMHQSLPVDQLALELPQYDFGIVSGGCERLGQCLDFLTDAYMKACYSGRIADYLDARLPVMVNAEVAYNCRLLRRHGILVELEGLFDEDFRERLLSLKRDPALTDAVERAAVDLSLERQSARLVAFYEKIANAHAEPVRIPLSAHFATQLPIFGKPLRRLRDEAMRANALTEQLDAARQERAAVEQRICLFKDQIVRLQEETARLQSLVDEIQSERNAANYHIGLVSSENSQLREANETLKLQMPAPRLAELQLRGDGVLTKEEADEMVGLLNWSEIADDLERSQGFGELMRIMQIAAANVDEGSFSTGSNPSKAWQFLNRKNLDQLLRDGYRRFKRTVALNYFTFPVQEADPQIRHLESLLNKDECADLRKLAEALSDDPDFSLTDQMAYRYHLLLLLAVAQCVDKEHLLNQLEEPDEGGPVTIQINERQLSQDLINSVLEYYSISEVAVANNNKPIIEIGGGYGRIAYVYQKLHPSIQYVSLDIPPAIYLAQRYLSSIFRGRKIFRVQNFVDFEEIREEFEQSDLVFLLPHQIHLIPENYFGLAINISSFGEMTMQQVNLYINEIDRTTTSYFYTKQWRESRNPFDDLTVSEEDYPIKSHWKTKYSRPVRTNAAFFEALYEVGAHP